MRLPRRRSAQTFFGPEWVAPMALPVAVVPPGEVPVPLVPPAVAVPAVLAYNWLQRRNKAIIEELARFSNDLHGYMMSGGTVRPVIATRGGAAAAAGGAKGGSPGGTTATGSAIGATHSGPK